MGEITPAAFAQTAAFLRPLPIHGHGVGNAGRYNFAEI